MIAKLMDVLGPESTNDEAVEWLIQNRAVLTHEQALFAIDQLITRVIILNFRNKMQYVVEPELPDEPDTTA